MDPVVLVHGGAGDITDDRVSGKIKGVKLAAVEGYKALKNGGSVLDAVESAVRLMEDDEYFNAGYGSVLNLNGDVEMDASIMLGSDLNAGAISITKDISHPISLARLVMEKTPHVILSAEGAQKFAESKGIPILEPGALVTDFAKKALEDYKQHGGQLTEIGGIIKPKNAGEVGTVGAVAVDGLGNVAAATSTGGINGKMPGRVSDTSQIGSGSYADNNSGAVSTTGHGETILKFCLAHSICKDMENGKSARLATKESVEKMTRRLNNTAGAITVSKIGEVGISFSSKRMAWAYVKGSELHFGIEQGQHEVECVEDEI
ncbi:isoaspartyl peptidase/L-asparaginase [Agrilus planipennis]|uniref:Isoaspartyl peptidase/L-asparaginase n=1 Tax=Agrilus planipennis TaxID=224129 RepID=A0A7F5R899_AGRPL|nr:isoaspartyl peptidase/L-asparaginase [Agrilus planipennis]